MASPKHSPWSCWTESNTRFNCLLSRPVAAAGFKVLPSFHYALPCNIFGLYLNTMCFNVAASCSAWSFCGEMIGRELASGGESNSRALQSCYLNVLGRDRREMEADQGARIGLHRGRSFLLPLPPSQLTLKSVIELVKAQQYCNHWPSKGSQV